MRNVEGNPVGFYARPKKPLCQGEKTPLRYRGQVASPAVKTNQLNSKLRRNGFDARL